MQQISQLLASIPLFDDHTKAFLLERASSLDEQKRAEFLGALSSYHEEKGQLKAEYREHRKVLDDELRSELQRLTNTAQDLEHRLTAFAQSFEEDPEDLMLA
ncbi:hypothetical protein COW46_02105 [Candidatus Gracilibacteria bacterium CG17_big_fil_post_rev_8_21_14_2_50_48_13]|nr:MAG: hypothetical protein COW46_02105 [Candidatus Gracilibacteria bacterium CG17_big_fil_post_rev_8_21_14_2_50_48_13]